MITNVWGLNTKGLANSHFIYRVQVRRAEPWLIKTF